MTAWRQGFFRLTVVLWLLDGAYSSGMPRRSEILGVA
jgi:hypothetical protein